MIGFNKERLMSESMRKKWLVLLIGLLTIAVISCGSTSQANIENSTVMMDLQFEHSVEGGTFTKSSICQGNILESDIITQHDLESGEYTELPYMIVGTTQHCATYNAYGYDYDPNYAAVESILEINANSGPEMWNILDVERIENENHDWLAPYLIFLYQSDAPSDKFIPIRNPNVAGPCMLEKTLHYANHSNFFNGQILIEEMNNVNRVRKAIGVLPPYDVPLSYLSGNGIAQNGDSGTGVWEKNGKLCAFVDGGNSTTNEVVAIEYPSKNIMQKEVKRFRDRELKILKSMY